VRLKPRLFKERLSDSENSLEQLSGIHLFERYYYDCLIFYFYYGKVMWLMRVGFIVVQLSPQFWFHWKWFSQLGPSMKISFLSFNGNRFLYLFLYCWRLLVTTPFCTLSFYGLVAAFTTSHYTICWNNVEC
jgi:hypothetical protein